MCFSVPKARDKEKEKEEEEEEEEEEGGRRKEEGGRRRFTCRSQLKNSIAEDVRAQEAQPFVQRWFSSKRYTLTAVCSR